MSNKNDWYLKDFCRHPEHFPPSHMVMKDGYKHVCPGCGRESVVRVPSYFDSTSLHSEELT